MKKYIKYLLSSFMLFSVFFATTKNALAVEITKATDYLIAKNEMVNENGYRYEGKSPNNYVTFNNELWRIVGVFEEKTDTGKIEKLVKLIRNDSIGKISWDTRGGNEGYNNWSISDMKNVLNGQYLSGENIDYTYQDGGKLKINDVSLNKTSQNMIQSVVWHLGGAESNFTASGFYEAERGTVGAGNKPSLIEWTGKVGLIYPSDYGYAVNSSVCERTIELADYYGVYEICYKNNWLYKENIDQWFITSDSKDYDDTFCIQERGYVTTSIPYSATDTFPSIYLKSNIGILNNGKDGSISKPYDLDDVANSTPTTPNVEKPATGNTENKNDKAPIEEIPENPKTGIVIPIISALTLGITATAILIYVKKKRIFKKI